MLEPWNDSSLLPPPVHTTKCDCDIDVQQLKYSCSIIIKVLSKQSPLHREGAMCSRFLYKFDKKFRNDIGYRNLKKVNTALRKYISVNFLKDVEHFQLALQSASEDLYLPTKQMLEYVLIRLMTFSKIILRINLCSKQAAAFYLDRIKRGESHWMSLMPYALLSRIWSISMVLLQHSCNWYLNLYAFLDKLNLKGLAFLPPEFKLPTDLEKWLDFKNLPYMVRFEWSQKKQMKLEQLFSEDTEGDEFENILDYVKQVNEESSKDVASEIKEVETIGKDIARDVMPKLKTETQIHVNSKIIDHGVKISRKSLETFFNKPTPASTHSAEKVTNKDSLLKFIKIEERFRNESHSQSLTGHLSFMQWQALKNSLQPLIESLSNNRKIQKKFQKLWKDKCEDYK